MSKKKRLTGIDCNKNGSTTKITSTTIPLRVQPIAIKSKRSMWYQRIGLKTRLIGLNSFTIPTRPTCIIHSRLDDRVRHRRFSHTPNAAAGTWRFRRWNWRRRWVQRWGSVNGSWSQPMCWWGRLVLWGTWEKNTRWICWWTVAVTRRRRRWTWSERRAAGLRKWWQWVERREI